MLLTAVGKVSSIRIHPEEDVCIIRRIEDALKDQKSWESWKNNIKNKYTSNGTRNNLDALFDYWGD